MNERDRLQSAGPGTPSAMRGGTLLGVFVGLVLGLAIAAAIAYFLGKSGLTGSPAAPGVQKEIVRNGKPETVPASTPEKPRFDFYKILPGTEEPKLAKAPETQTKPVDRLWLQAGAFASESDADNLKARLALSGWEASVQMATLSDKSVRYRVRLGPYDNTDELNRIKADLGKSGFDVAVIKNP
ncbi:MAG TPA: SPOR domain-containing protein [Casimicrobiaceae bacterium]|nr:SPOR domain-containing protein [Casimicrobiaceae bacterium]